MKDQIEKYKKEEQENKRKAFSNIGKDIKDIEPYGNKEFLKLLEISSIDISEESKKLDVDINKLVNDNFNDLIVK